MSLMKQEDWDAYNAALDEWQQDAFQQKIIWVKNNGIIDPNGEGPGSSKTQIEIKGLIQSNYFRSWPVTSTNAAGEIDKQSILFYLNINYLITNGWANAQDRQFKFDPGYDRFIVNGLEYKALGESQAGQANDKPIFVFVILKREETNTGETKYG